MVEVTLSGWIIAAIIVGVIGLIFVVWVVSWDRPTGGYIDMSGLASFLAVIVALVAVLLVFSIRGCIATFKQDTAKVTIQPKDTP